MKNWGKLEMRSHMRLPLRNRSNESTTEKIWIRRTANHNLSRCNVELFTFTFFFFLQKIVRETYRDQFQFGMMIESL